MESDFNYCIEHGEHSSYICSICLKFLCKECIGIHSKDAHHYHILPIDAFVAKKLKAFLQEERDIKELNLNSFIQQKKSTFEMLFKMNKEINEVSNEIDQIKRKFQSIQTLSEEHSSNITKKFTLLSKTLDELTAYSEKEKVTNIKVGQIDLEKYFQTNSSLIKLISNFSTISEDLIHSLSFFRSLFQISTTVNQFQYIEDIFNRLGNLSVSLDKFKEFPFKNQPQDLSFLESPESKQTNKIWPLDIKIESKLNILKDLDKQIESKALRLKLLTEEEVKNLNINKKSIPGDIKEKFKSFKPFISKNHLFSIKKNMEDNKNFFIDQDINVQNTIKFGLENLNIPTYSGIELVKNKLYISGGINSEQFIDDFGFIKLKLDKRRFFKLENMNHFVCRHSLLYLNKALYLMGGKITENFSDKCKKFNLRTYEWEDYKKLNEAKMDLSTCSFKEKFIYVFGGRGFNSESEMSTLSTIEYIETTNQGLMKWERLTLDVESEWREISLIGIVGKKDGKILLLGGLDRLQKIQDSIWEFNPEKKLISLLHSKLNESDYFPSWCIRGKCVEGNFFLLGNEKYHFFSRSKQKWNSFP